MPKCPEPTEELVTAFEVAKRFGVAVATVRRWVREDRIPYTRVSRRTVRFQIREIEAATSSPQAVAVAQPNFKDMSASISTAAARFCRGSRSTHQATD